MVSTCEINNSQGRYIFNVGAQIYLKGGKVKGYIAIEYINIIVFISSALMNFQ